jgi:hypothetical protein
MNRTVYPTIFTVRRTSQHRRAICGNYALFAERKQQWIASNPGASPMEYDRAMQRIARECEV